MFTLLLCLFLLEMFSVFFLCCYFCPALPSGGGRLLARADRRLSRQHSQQSLTHSQAQSVSSLTSDLWDRSSAETPGIFPPRFCFLLTAGWTHGPTYVSRLWSTDETNSLSPRRTVHEGHCEVFIVNISQRVSQQQRQSFPRKQKQNSVVNVFALTPLSLCVSVSLTQLLCSLERTIRASRCSSSSITATCIRPACRLSDLSPLLHTQAPWYALLQQSFFWV